MDEQNKQPEQNKPEKKLSRTTLTFYIVGLFSVAIALILISYVAQSRADKQVENLSSQLTQQQTVAQPSALLLIIHGIEQKVKHPVSARTPQGKQHRVVQSDGRKRPGVGARVRKVHIS